MSQNFNIDAVLQVDQAIGEVDQDFWSGVLQASLHDPRKALADGIENAITSYEGNEVDCYEDELEDGDEFDEIADRESSTDFEGEDDAECDNASISSFSLSMDVTLSGGYCLEDYIADANKVAYLAAMSKGVKIFLKIEHTWLDRGPDDGVTMKWWEMVKKFGKSV